MSTTSNCVINRFLYLFLYYYFTFSPKKNYYGRKFGKLFFLSSVFSFCAYKLFGWFGGNWNLFLAGKQISWLESCLPVVWVLKTSSWFWWIHYGTFMSFVPRNLMFLCLRIFVANFNLNEILKKLSPDVSRRHGKNFSQKLDNHRIAVKINTNNKWRKIKDSWLAKIIKILLYFDKENRTENKLHYCNNCVEILF